MHDIQLPAVEKAQSEEDEIAASSSGVGGQDEAQITEYDLNSQNVVSFLGVFDHLDWRWGKFESGIQFEYKRKSNWAVIKMGKISDGSDSEANEDDGSFAVQKQSRDSQKDFSQTHVPAEFHAWGPQWQPQHYCFLWTLQLVSSLFLLRY